MRLEDLEKDDNNKVIYYLITKTIKKPCDYLELDDTICLNLKILLLFF